MQSLKKFWRTAATVEESPLPAPASVYPELSLSLTSLEEWKAAVAEVPFVFTPTYVEAVVQRARDRGVYSAFFGEQIPSAEVTVLSSNYRESLLARGLNPRLRAVLDLLSDEKNAAEPGRYSIFAPEALTPFALLLRGRFPRFVGSEYAETEPQRESLFPIPVEDLTRLSFRADAFDCVIANEVFEHIPDLNQALLEIHRVLKRTGVLLATFPFACNDFEPVIRARLITGSLQFLAEPEYHGNPADPEAGSLVFQIPGWSVLEDCRRAGFRKTEIVFISSPERGITSAEFAGIHVLRCRK